MAERTYEIKSCIGTLSDRVWAPQLNLISWNHGKAVYDLRKWNLEDGTMGKGLTLSKDELLTLRDILNEHFEDEA